MTEDVSQIPIDVHVNKLLEWLLSRHHCTREWPDKIAYVRTKIHDALQDMPENEELKKILIEASPMTYFHCQRIVEVLKETEKDTKNIFGGYSSRRMQDWQEVLKLYQKDNLYLAECASILGRNVIYEIPALKRGATRSEQAQSDSIKKEASLKKQSTECRDKFTHSCAQLGIQFDNLDLSSVDIQIPTVEATGAKIINQMCQKLPAIFKELTEKTGELRDAVEYYRRFLKHTAKLTDVQLAECLPMLYTLIDKGNITTYEWKYGEPPVQVQVPELSHSFEAAPVDDADTGEIDFGDLGDAQLETGEIDWGGIEEVPDTGIDFSSVDDIADDANIGGIVLEDAGLEGGVATGEEALSVLENVQTRKQFVNDLCELQGFLSIRIDETEKEKSSVMMSMLLEFKDTSLRCDNLEKLLSRTNQILGILNESTTKQYLLAREDKRYVSTVAEGLLHNLQLARRYDQKAEEWVGVRAKLLDELKTIQPRISVLTRQSKEIQIQLSKEISKRYNNRPVYITGGVA